MLDSQTRYPGAQPFEDDELSRKTFFGREQESADLANKILANRLVVVYAKSGLGKTSLLNAGVAQRLRDEKHLPLIVRVNDVTRGPFSAVIEGVHIAAKRQAVEYVPGGQASLWHFFKTAEFWQGDLLLTPVLILDQFEELFTLQNVEARAAFLSDLGFLVRGVPPTTTPQAVLDTTKSGDLRNELTDIPPALRIVLSLREDYLGYLEEAADRISQILDHRFRLMPLSVEAAKEAIAGPAGLKDSKIPNPPFDYDPAAISTIIDHLSHRSRQMGTHMMRSVEPFQLQLICQRIERIVVARQQGNNSVLTVTMKDIGGETALRATLRDFYKEELRTLSSWRQRRNVHCLCEEYLISPEGRRLSLEENEIRRQLKLPHETLKKLVDRRLLRSDQRADSTYYELSHDTLIEPILASRRIMRRSLGFLTAVAGALLLLIVVGALFVYSVMLYQDIFGSGIPVPESISEMDHERYRSNVRSEIYKGLFLGAPVITFFGGWMFRKGIRTFRRYRSRI